MKLYSQLFVFLLWLLVLAIIIKYFLLAWGILHYGDWYIQEQLNFVQNQIRSNDIEKEGTDAEKSDLLLSGSNVFDNWIIESDTWMMFDDYTNIKPAEFLPKEWEHEGLYMYLNTKIDIADDIVYNEFMYILSRVIRQNWDVFVRPLWNQSNDFWELIRWWYICSNGWWAYWEYVFDLLSKSRSIENIRKDILLRWLTNKITDFESCIWKDTERTLLLSRAVNLNVREYPESTIIDIIRIIKKIKK